MKTIHLATGNKTLCGNKAKNTTEHGYIFNASENKCKQCLKLITQNKTI